MKAVILAGGSGERFWPVSTPNQPKQFIRLFSDNSLLRNTFDRLRARFDPVDIFIITSREHVNRTREEIPELSQDNIVGEPARMNTGPACFVGAIMASEGEVILTVPADHHIPDEGGFWKCVDKAIEACPQMGGLFTFGIEPTRPDTGYGYIEKGRELINGVYDVSQFREKPDPKTASGFLDAGGFLWNSGMFLWRKEDLFDGMKEFAPSVFEPLKDLDPGDEKELEEAYRNVERISIDNCLLERSDRVRVVPGGFRWSDVGTWTSIKELLDKTSDSPDLLLEGSENVYVRSETGRDIAVLGLKDLIVIDTEDGLLICSDDSSQLVRKASRKFRDQKAFQGKTI